VGASGYLATSIPLRLASAGSVVALPILSVQRLDDLAVGGALVAASLAPAVVVAPFAGVALDRARRPRRLVVLAAAITVVAFAAGALLGVLPVWLIAALLVAAGCAAPFYFGGLVGAVASAARRWTRLTPAVVMGGGFAIIGLITLLAVPDLGMPWTVIVIGLSGLLNASTSAAMLLLRKVNSPPQLRSQVFTIGSGLRSASAALGAAVAGALAGLDAGWLVAGVGALWVLGALVMAGYRSPAAEPVTTPTGSSSAT
jgi:hypothetical protein